MFCENCLDSDFKLGTTSLDTIICGKTYILSDLECYTCLSCGEISFTHKQSLEIDKRRLALEYDEKALLTQMQLKWLRRILDLSLDSVCEMLNIGKNSYGRWERGEVEITPSMNLLVHNLIDKFPSTRVNLFEYDRNLAIDKANFQLLNKDISFGEYIRETLKITNIMSFVVYESVGVDEDLFVKIQNNDINPEKIPFKKTAKLAKFFRLQIEKLSVFLDFALDVFEAKNNLDYAHARSIKHGEMSRSIQSSSINKIVEKLIEKNKISKPKSHISNEYMAMVKDFLEQLSGSNEVLAS